MLQVTKTNSPNRIRQQINFNSLAKNVNKLFTDLEISSNNIGLTAQPVLIYVDQPKKFMWIKNMKLRVKELSLKIPLELEVPTTPIIRTLWSLAWKVDESLTLKVKSISYKELRQILSSFAHCKKIKILSSHIKGCPEDFKINRRIRSKVESLYLKLDGEKVPDYMNIISQLKKAKYYKWISYF